MFFKSEIIKNELQVAEQYYRIRLKVSANFKSEPGQFVMLKIDNRFDPLLPRPFSISYAGEKYMEIIYKVVGRTTRILSNLKKGGKINILGPLGKGFIINEKINKHILIAGGYGVAPLLFLAYKFKKLKKDVIILIGAKNKNLLVCKNEFKKLGIVKVATDNGSYGYKGFVTDLLKNEIINYSDKSTFDVYACGPTAMLKRVIDIVSKQKIPAQVSLENIMGCGIGVCLSCVCKSRDGSYKLTCTDGPVFSSEDIQLE